MVNIRWRTSNLFKYTVSTKILCELWLYNRLTISKLNLINEEWETEEKDSANYSYFQAVN